MPGLLLSEINFCTFGARRLRVTAPFAMFAVWMRPVASAVPPAMARNAARLHASVVFVRMIVVPFCVGRPRYADRPVPTGQVTGVAQKRTFGSYSRSLLGAI